ncbi:uncharacterized protein LMH87_008781 [Akanthomyces muscarius]|uniref:Uncharacterized protein n=1 Tax=Akanthomyces muscarius TaxID=2231603 RepID=A0A9W8QHW0_AKAMU|nr:uncharacterized protein LMH87_008781 [Akanthomyces muscarius]KAJ4158248.1 hypothetical protein LMH87_008781 [Akanthomyces muscarius]
MRTTSPLIGSMVIAGVLANASLFSRRQLSPANTATAPAATTTSIQDGGFMSNNVQPLNNDSSAYHLGYREEDFAQPCARCYNPKVPDLRQPFLDGLSRNPYARGRGYTAHEVAEIFSCPGYFENVYTIDANGTLMIAVISETPEGSVVLGPIFQKQPTGTNTTLKDRYFGRTSFINVYIGEESAPLSIKFVDPVLAKLVRTWQVPQVNFLSAESPLEISTFWSKLPGTPCFLKASARPSLRNSSIDRGLTVRVPARGKQVLLPRGEPCPWAHIGYLQPIFHS